MKTLAALLRRSDRMRFREKLIMPSAETFGRLMHGFQRETFAALDRLPRRHAMLVRTRGASKTFDIGIEGVVELFHSLPGARLYAAAVDKDQAAILHGYMAGLIKRTPALAPAATIERWRIILPAIDAVLEVLPADSASSWGLSGTWYAVDELHAFRTPEHEEFFWSLWSSTPKRSARMIVMTTMPWDRTSLCWKILELAQSSDRWIFDRYAEPAPWLDPAFVEEQRASLPEHVFRRLFLGEAVEGAAAFFTEAQVARVFVDRLPAVSGGWHTVGCDLGVKRDSAAVAVVRRVGDEYHVVDLQVWTPGRDEVDLGSVMVALKEASMQHYRAPIYLDPWNGALMKQELQRAGLIVNETVFTPTTRAELFQILRGAIVNGRLLALPHERLRNELLSLEVTDTKTGSWRVDHRAGQHDDAVISIGLALRGLHLEAQKPRPIYVGIRR